MVDYLLNNGRMVIEVDNYQTGTSSNLRHLQDNPRFTMLQSVYPPRQTAPFPLTDKFPSIFVRHNIQSPLLDIPPLHSIYHLACPASPPQYQKDPVDILERATSEVYGSPQVHPQPESYWGHLDPFGPRSCYDEGKRASEALAWAFKQPPRSVDVRVARIFNTYGPRLAPQDGRVVSNFVAAALNNRPLIITGDGTATRSFQYGDDCVRGLVALMGAENVSGPVNIGNDVEVTLSELADLVGRAVKQLTGSETLPVEYKPLPVDDPPMRRPDITLAKRTLGWSPIVPLEEGWRRRCGGTWLEERMTTRDFLVEKKGMVMDYRAYLENGHGL